MLRFTLAHQYTEQYHNVVSCALNIEDLISNNFFLIQHVIKKFPAYFSARFTNQLTDSWAILYNVRLIVVTSGM
jgi:hypothetical protein